MTAIQADSHRFVAKVIDFLDDWFGPRLRLNEPMEYEADPGELGRIAREFGATPGDLMILLRHRPAVGGELPKMLDALGIDMAVMQRVEPALMRDMKRACAVCMHKEQCRRELDASTAQSNYVEYCGNADAVDMLRLKS